MMADVATVSVEPIEFIDLGAQRRRIGSRMDEAIRRVIDHGRFILGPEVARLERQLAEFCGAKHVLSCANGTDALGLALMAKGAGPGQAILVPSFTFAATAEVVAWFGATPIFVDVIADTFNMAPASLEAGIATARRLGLTPSGVIPVDLFGLPADYDEILAIAAASRHVGAVRCGTEFRGRIQGPPGRNDRRFDDDELFSGQAAWLLWRWGRRVPRRRRHNGGVEEPARAWPGQ